MTIKRMQMQQTERWIVLDAEANEQFETCRIEKRIAREKAVEKKELKKKAK